jgi:hypothetical protein
MRTAILLVSLTAALFSTACLEKEVVKNAREYFPKADVSRVGPLMLHVETHVGNVSRKLCTEITLAMIQKKGADLSMALSIDGYRYFSLGFDEYNVVWDMQSQTVTTMDPSQAGQWFIQTFGYQPEMEKLAEQ